MRLIQSFLAQVRDIVCLTDVNRNRQSVGGEKQYNHIRLIKIYIALYSRPTCEYETVSISIICNIITDLSPCAWESVRMSNQSPFEFDFIVQSIYIKAVVRAHARQKIILHTLTL